MKRRTLLKSAAAAAGLLALAGCGGSEPTEPVSLAAAPSPAPAPAQSPAPAWNVTLPSFPVGSNSTFNLATTLPTGVETGGTFGISANGAALPAGMTLSPGGILSVGSATVSRAEGVIFTYTEPSR